jgi:hypothetical protein
MKKKPTMYARSSYTLQFGDGSRGMCAISEINMDDGQLRDCLNLWYRGKELRSRPGIRYTGSILPNAQLNDMPVAVSEFCLLSEVMRKDTGEMEEQDFGYYILYLDEYGKYFSVQAYCSRGTHAGQMLGSLGASSVVTHKDGAFAIGNRRGLSFSYTGSDGIERTKTCDDVTVFYGTRVQTLCESSAPVNPGAVSFSDVKAYVPLVYKGKAPNGDNAQLTEEYNMLSRRWKEQFTTASENDYIYRMSRGNLNCYAKHTVTYSYDDDGVKEVVFTIEPSLHETSYKDSDTVTLSGGPWETEHQVFIRVHYKSGAFVVYERVESSGTDAYQAFFLTRTNDIPNNLLIETEGSEPVSDTYCLISDCVACSWFGGNTHSLNGGGHLFVAGTREHPDLVYYSSPSYPSSYFPENYNIAVGDPGDPIVAMARQYNALIVFKRNSTYAITYDGYDEELDLSGKSTQSPPKYTCTCINDQIGCWSKGSVRLIDNYLVWLGTGNKIYMLRSFSQYSTRSIREISLNIESVMDGIPAPIPDVMEDSTEPRIMTASFDWNGYYILVSGDRAWAWNYRATPYTDSSNTEKVQRALSWYRFTLPETFLLGACEQGGTPVLFTGDKAYTLDDAAHTDLVYEDGQTVETAYIKRYASIRYDLEAPYTLKAMGAINLSLSGDSTAECTITGQFDDDDAEIAHIFPEGQDGTLDKVYRLYSHRKTLRRVGITVESESPGILGFPVSPTAAITLLGDIH